jgi:hypothetical protein
MVERPISMGTALSETDEDLRPVVARVALLNLTYFRVRGIFFMKTNRRSWSPLWVRS